MSVLNKNEWLSESLREFADALDKDRGHGKSFVTILMRQAAARLEVLEAVADDAVALLDQHISDEQRRELGHRVIERLT